MELTETDGAINRLVVEAWSFSEWILRTSPKDSSEVELPALEPLMFWRAWESWRFMTAFDGFTVKSMIEAQMEFLRATFVVLLKGHWRVFVFSKGFFDENSLLAFDISQLRCRRHYLNCKCCRERHEAEHQGDWLTDAERWFEIRSPREFNLNSSLWSDAQLMRQHWWIHFVARWTKRGTVFNQFVGEIFQLWTNCGGERNFKFEHKILLWLWMNGNMSLIETNVAERLRCWNNQWSSRLAP